MVPLRVTVHCAAKADRLEGSMRRPGYVAGSLFLFSAISACSQGAKKPAEDATKTSPAPTAAATTPAATTPAATTPAATTPGAATPAETTAQATPPTGPDPEAVAALQRMSGYLSSLNSFELVSDASLDAITRQNQRVQLGGVAHYKVKRPGIWLDFQSDLKNRRYFYDGKQFTIFAPNLNYYATSPAPPTNAEFLKQLDNKYGVSLPLADLFRWNDADNSDVRSLKSGFEVGPARIDGIPTDHWAFRQGDYDWEVWIEQGARPLPRKLVIIDRSDPTYPTYTARLQWVLNPALPAALFTFKPTKGAKQIHLATFRGDTK
jgi:hypothetical protein